MQRSKYTADFKSEAVKQLVDKGQTVVDVALTPRIRRRGFVQLGSQVQGR